MADAKVTVAPAPVPAGPDIDNTTETTGVGTVYRQRVSVAGVGGNNQLAVDASGRIAVTGTFFQTTQPVSGSVLLTGEANEALQALRWVAGRRTLNPRVDRLRRMGLHA